MVNTVEVYPKWKICPAACGHCDLKLSGKSPTSNKMDKDVHETLSLLQELFQKYSMPRDMSYPYPLKGDIQYKLPIIEPGLIRNMWLPYGTIDDQTMRNADAVIDDILKKTEFLIGPIKHETSPHFNISIDFVPHGLYLSEDEISFTKLFVERYKKFIDESTYCNVWIVNFLNNRSSAAQVKKERRTMTEKEGDMRESYMKSLSKEAKTKQTISWTKKDDSTAVLNYGVLATNGEKKMYVGKRAIALLDPDFESEDKQRDRARIIRRNEKKQDIVVSLHPHGILLDHSSVDVKNPLLWTTHEYFREEIKFLFSPVINKRSNFYTDTLQRIIWHNMNFHEYQKYLSKEENNTQK